MLPIQFRQDTPNFYIEVAENIKILMDTNSEVRKQTAIHVCHLSKLKCID